MIVKIQPPHANIIAAVRYNEQKMNATDKDSVEKPTEEENVDGITDGRILATMNVDENSSLADEFENLIYKSRKAKKRGPVLENPTFHMSINPSDTDRPLSDDEVINLTMEIMEGLGYGKQPYRIYEHTDIPRKHYHVVSCRIDENGKKINDSYEWMNLRRQLLKLQNKYGFEIILNEFEEKKAKKDEVKQVSKKTEKNKEISQSAKKEYQKPFSQSDPTPVTNQIKDIIQDSLRWHFSTFNQYQELLHLRYNVLVEVQQKPDTPDGILTFAGTDDEGKPVNRPMTEQELGIKLLEQIREKAYKEKMHNRREQRERLEKLTRTVAESTSTYDEFVSVMKKKGVWVIPYFDDTGTKIYGLTYLDRATRCAWKGSETAVNVEWFNQTAKEKKWQFTKDKYENVREKRSKMPSRQPFIPKVDTTPKPTSNTLPALTAVQKKATKKATAVGHQKGSDADVTKNKDNDNRNDDNDKNKKYIGE